MRTRYLIAMGAGLLILLSLLPAAWAGRRRGEAPAAGGSAPTGGAAIATPEAEPATTTPTATLPTPTPTPFVFPVESRISGVDIGGLTAAAATERVAEHLRGYQRTVVLYTSEFSSTLRTGDVVKLPSAERAVARAQAAVRGSTPVKQSLYIGVDRPVLRAALERIAPSIDRAAETTVISDAKAITQTFTFAYRLGRRLDINQSVTRLATALPQRDGAERIELAVDPVGPEPLPMAELERVLKAHAGFWDGIAGFYVRDLETGETLTYNADTVFSGASLMKVPIMIYAYAQLGALDEQQQVWMRKMIVDSENIEANNLLAAAVGGQGTEDALIGVNKMTEMLRELGLERTYQLIPYESGEWLILQSLLPGGGPAREGAEPFTEADPYVRTTPGEMGELFVMLDDCARGKGVLIEQAVGKLDERLCDEMIAWLQRPHDQERMVAGLPAGTPIAHKGGWITDMQSDIGIVESPGGRYVAGIFIWRDGYVTDVYANPSPYLGDFSHTIYTFFNPVPVDQVGRGEPWEPAGE